MINVARGSVVDERELIAALRDGTLGSARLDAFEEELCIPEELRKMENVVLLPHVGSATIETRRRMGDLAVDNILGCLVKGSSGAYTPIQESEHILML